MLVTGKVTVQNLFIGKMLRRQNFSSAKVNRCERYNREAAHSFKLEHFGTKGFSKKEVKNDFYLGSLKRQKARYFFAQNLEILIDHAKIILTTQSGRICRKAGIQLDLRLTCAAYLVTFKHLVCRSLNASRTIQTENVLNDWE